MKNKKGFSLLHLLILLVTISLMMVALAPIVSKKTKEKVGATVITNQFICVWLPNEENQLELHQIRVRNNKLISDNNVTQDGFCTFEPEQGTNIYDIKMQGAGGGGGGYFFEFQKNGIWYSGRLNDTTARTLANLQGLNTATYGNAKALAGGVRHFFNNVFNGAQISILGINTSNDDASIDPYVRKWNEQYQGDKANCQGLSNIQCIEKSGFWNETVSKLMAGKTISGRSTCDYTTTSGYGYCNKSFSYTFGNENVDNIVSLSYEPEYGYFKGGKSGNITSNNCSTSNPITRCTISEDGAKIRLAYDYKYLRSGTSGEVGEYVNEQKASLNPSNRVFIYPGKGGLAGTEGRGNNTNERTCQNKVWGNSSIYRCVTCTKDFNLRNSNKTFTYNCDIETTTTAHCSRTCNLNGTNCTTTGGSVCINYFNNAQNRNFYFIGKRCARCNDSGGAFPCTECRDAGRGEDSIVQVENQDTKWTAQGGAQGNWDQDGAKKLYLFEGEKTETTGALGKVSKAPNIVVPSDNGNITLPKGRSGAGAGFDKYSCNEGYLAVSHPFNSANKSIIKSGVNENILNSGFARNDVIHTGCDDTIEVTHEDGTVNETPREFAQSGENGFVVITW